MVLLRWSGRVARRLVRSKVGPRRSTKRWRGELTPGTTPCRTGQRPTLSRHRGRRVDEAKREFGARRRV